MKTIFNVLETLFKVSFLVENHEEVANNNLDNTVVLDAVEKRGKHGQEREQEPEIQPLLFVLLLMDITEEEENSGNNNHNSTETLASENVSKKNKNNGNNHHQIMSRNMDGFLNLGHCFY